MGIFGNKKKVELDINELAHNPDEAATNTTNEFFFDKVKEEFPDNPDEKWTISEIKHTPNGSYIKAEPESYDVGYESFVFLLSFTDGLEISATYCYEDGKYNLLCTSRNCPKNRPDVICW